MLTVIILFLSGMLGILVHNLVKIDKINRATNGGFDHKQFFRLEWPSLAISVCVVIAFLMGRQYVNVLQNAGEMLGGGFFCIGLAAQSIAYNFQSRYTKPIANDETAN